MFIYIFISISITTSPLLDLFLYRTLGNTLHVFINKTIAEHSAQYSYKRLFLSNSTHNEVKPQKQNFHLNISTRLLPSRFMNFAILSFVPHLFVDRIIE